MNEFKYNYHVVYYYKKGFENGIGTVELNRICPLDKCSEIRSAAEFIKNENKLDNVVIINFIKVKGE